jgi:hypothetical protein
MNYAEWRDDGSDRWVENDNGNLVWICSGEVIATVFTYSDESWGAVWNGSEDSEPRFLKARCDSAEEALSLLEDAIEEGDESPMWWPLGNQWTQSKKGSFYRKVDGAIISVKQAKSGSWYAVGMDGMLGQGGRPMWFNSAAEARKAVDRFALGNSGMQLIRQAA